MGANPSRTEKEPKTFICEANILQIDHWVLEQGESGWRSGTINSYKTVKVMFSETRAIGKMVQICKTKFFAPSGTRIPPFSG